jgi:alpha-glucosidase
MNHPDTSAQPLAWWQSGVVYQLWVRSYCDSDGDGNGDLAGLIGKLDYLTWLGVDVLWLSPVYPSPMIEAGYDVSDYTNVGRLYGSLEDFDRLLDGAHRRGLKVILDFVPNHTSDAHPWFVESRSSRDNAKRGWYLWHDAKPGGSPPNNWVSCFGGSAWTYDKESGQFYYHAFLPQQPDLNWRNAQMQAAVFDAMRFWLIRGLDGFRMDAIWHLIKDEKLRDNPPNPNYTPDPSAGQCRHQRVHTRPTRSPSVNREDAPSGRRVQRSSAERRALPRGRKNDGLLRNARAARTASAVEPATFGAELERARNH